MASESPNFETIFTPEHWGETPPMPTYKARGPFRRRLERMRENEFPHGKFLSHKAEWLVGEALGRGAHQIMQGEIPVPISDGETVGGEADDNNAVSGNILLMDTESVVLRRGFREISDSSRAIQDESDLAATPIRLIRRGFKRETSLTVEPMSYSYFEPIRSVLNYVERKRGVPHEPYEEDLGDLRRSIVPEYDRFYVDNEQGRYRHTISLVAFFTARDGSVGSRMASQCTLWDDDEPSAWLESVYPHEKGNVGETVNRSVTDDVLVMTRLRGAYICARGAFEHAKSTVKSTETSTVLKPSTTQI